MAITKMGLVRYADDPDKKYFRIVNLGPGEDDSLLTDSAMVTEWTTLGVDGTRTAVMDVMTIAAGRAALALQSANLQAWTSAVVAAAPVGGPSAAQQAFISGLATPWGPATTNGVAVS